ncbi:MAG: ATP-binding cassette domain-containing protein [Tissierellia bacterium]|nr:ATP-binding cassette domain-containing protein [Tissierellia bacterium]
MEKTNRETLIEVKNLKKYFKIKRNVFVQAVDDVTFDIYKGETLGLVGESGCGKTTCGKTILGLYDATDGKVIFNGIDVHSLTPEEKKDFTKKAQIIFQDPYSSLNPRMTVGDIIGEGIDIHGLYKNKEREEKIFELLYTVGLNREHINRFPHEFSGGQRQRIGIARALAIEPNFIVCDEPVSALDVSIQAQIVNLLMDLQREKGLTYLFIAHDLSMIKYISDRVGVMYVGNLVELTTSKELYKNPLHPYTQALLSAIPIPDPKMEREKKRIPIKGEIPSTINPPIGCRFASRCKYVMDICKEAMPKLVEVDKGHFVACYLHHKEKAN